MKEISKSEFIRRITNGKSVFIGISPVLNDDEIVACKRNLATMHYTERAAKAKGQHITFSNDSHLYLDNNDTTETKCFEEDNVLVVNQKFTSKYYGFPDEVTYKNLYYAMV